MADDHVKRGHPSQAELESRIAATQASLAQRLDALTSEIRNEVHQTLERVATSVESGVENVTDTLGHNFQQVSTTVQDVVGDLRSTLNVQAKVQGHPLRMFGYAILAGAAAGAITGRHSGNKRRQAEPSPTSRVPQPATGAAALFGLSLALMKPVLLSAAKEIVTRKIHQRMDQGRGERADYRAAGGGVQGGPVYHSY